MFVGIVVSNKKMKSLFLFGLCIAVVVSTPINDNDDDHDNQHNQNRRRLQTLSLKLVDENDGQRNNVDRDDDDNNDDRRNNDDFGALRELVKESYDVDGPQVTPKNTYANEAKVKLIY
ncbi:PREDICTED: uncharacterized protein LOC106125706 [Papilio xuthus]|uniref:Uncharacterized protein LOC106125706 n=1 Tax=Papilio xuthus TaxID=66420 RepID=A0AAJ6ZSM1_PAPXU|nr:PREDICTED: uncharacterized protein LOC106125706 [Papilio xuthus]